MKNKLALAALLSALVVVVAWYATRVVKRSPTSARLPLTAVSNEIHEPRTPLDDEHDLGAPLTFGRLTVFPIYATHQEDLGRFTTLEDALSKKEAEVRELGADGDAAQVNRLVIENKGDVSIFVLAGTVVKGGHQDRQIGQDVVIAPHATANVDAFCVESGRWTDDRNGVAMKGKFGTSKVLANAEIRAAGQYEKNQGEVWSKVGKVNGKSKKVAASGTLMATLDAKEIVDARAKLAERVETDLRSVGRPGDVVGLAYAVDGKVHGARWFANHELFELFRGTLVHSAALEAVIGMAPEKPSPDVVSNDAIKAFLAGVNGADTKEERTTTGENVNAYKESHAGYGSHTTLKPAATSAGTAMKKAAKLSVDFVAK
jgi:hypothetical protein